MNIRLDRSVIHARPDVYQSCLLARVRPPP
jgi:hypothetical protein